MVKNRVNKAVYNLVLTAVFIAIVVIFQLFLGGITVSGVSFSLVLVPIVLGGAVLNESGGAILGLVFGLITLINGLTGTDPFTSFLLFNTGFKGTAVTAAVCIVKAVLAGFLSAYVFKILKGKSETLAIILAAAVAPIVNTGVFVLAMIFILPNELSEAMNALSGINIGEIGIVNFVILSLSGINFVVEFLVNIVLTPAVYPVTKLIKKGN